MLPSSYSLIFESIKHNDADFVRLNLQFSVMELMARRQHKQQQQQQQQHDPSSSSSSLSLSSIFDSHVSEWIDAIRGNTTVRHVNILLPLVPTPNMTMCDEPKIQSVLDAVASLPALKELTIAQNTLGSLGSFRAIASAIDCYSGGRGYNNNLEVLHVNGSSIIIAEDHHHDNNNGGDREEDNNSRESDNAHVHAHAHHHNNEKNDLATLARTVQRKQQQQHHYLKEVGIGGFPMTQDHVCALLPVLRLRENNSNNIKDLTLGTISTTAAWLTLLENLKQDNTNTNTSTNHQSTEIESLTFIFSQPMDDAICKKLAQVIQSNNRNLRVLGLRYVPIRHALEPPSCGISEQGQIILTQMMETNYFIQEFETRGPPIARIQFYAKLNWAGRKRLLFQQQQQDGQQVDEDITTPKQSDWIQVLEKLINDVECIFYILIQNPSLCAYNNTQKK